MALVVEENECLKGDKFNSSLITYLDLSILKVLSYSLIFWIDSQSIEFMSILIP